MLGRGVFRCKVLFVWGVMGTFVHTLHAAGATIKSLINSISSCCFVSSCLCDVRLLCCEAVSSSAAASISNEYSQLSASVYTQRMAFQGLPFIVQPSVYQISTWIVSHVNDLFRFNVFNGMLTYSPRLLRLLWEKAVRAAYGQSRQAAQ